jgi:hypothetical protein
MHTSQDDFTIEVEDNRQSVTNPTELPAKTNAGNVYEPFIKSTSSRGHGLGLSIVHRLCERFNVDLTIEFLESRTVASFSVE